MPIPQIQNPYTLTVAFFTDKARCERSKLDMTIHHRLDGERPDKRPPDWVMVVREEARSRAIHAMWGMFPHCRTMMQVLKAADGIVGTLNPYVIGAEQAEFQREFRKEVYCQLDAIVAEKGKR